MHTSSSSTQVERSNNLSHLCHKRSNPCLEQSHSQARCSRPYPVNFCVFPRMEVPHLSGPFPASACTHFPHSTHQKKKNPPKKPSYFSEMSLLATCVHYITTAASCTSHQILPLLQSSKRRLKMQMCFWDDTIQEQVALQYKEPGPSKGKDKFPSSSQVCGRLRHDISIPFSDRNSKDQHFSESDREEVRLLLRKGETEYTLCKIKYF